MRLFLLPISTRRTLLYCDRRLPTPTSTKPESWLSLSRITNKANVTWVAWEKADGGWKKQVTTYGNRLLDRIPYQEWGLKTIPALTPKRREQDLQSPTPVDVIFPSRFLPRSRIHSILTAHATDRQSLHRQRMIYSVIGMPFTAPFALIPIVPNLPFFYLVYRAYSHWKALRGSQHLSHILSLSLLNPTPSDLLDQVYTAGLMHPTRAESRAAPYPTPEQMTAVADTVEKQTNGGDEDVMVLQRWNGKLIAERFGLPDMEVEIERAVAQVESSIKAREELLEEKQELESAAKAARPASTGSAAAKNIKGKKSIDAIRPSVRSAAAQPQQQQQQQQSKKAGAGHAKS